MLSAIPPWALNNSVEVCTATATFKLEGRRFEHKPTKNNPVK